MTSAAGLGEWRDAKGLSRRLAFISGELICGSLQSPPAVIETAIDILTASADVSVRRRSPQKSVTQKGVAMAKYLEGTDTQKNRAYSPAVITEGGRIVWMAGQTATVDGDGKDISGNFEAQTHRVFALMAESLHRAGGTLANLVTMTVFIKEPRYGDRFVELRKQKFPDGHYPGSALITVANFARPGMEIEIQAIAVIGDRAT
jgi:2-iminobutanoate/2-iminopropanoate deaminase